MKKSSSFALGNFFKTKKQILKADIQKLLKTNQINYVDPKYGTALNRAINLKDEKIITELLAKKVDINEAIYFAIGHEYTLEEIKTLISLSSSELPDEYLYKTVHQGRLDLVQYFFI